MSQQPTDTGTRIKRSLAQSNYITAAWTWFMILAGKAAEPVLVASVLYASVKLLPMVHFPPQCDVVVFIAQFVALDVGGLSLTKLADQAKREGNEDGAKQARRLSIALVGIMLVGVIMAGLDQIVKLDGQVATVIDTLLVIARAVMAVLYSRVIHSVKKDDQPEPPREEEIESLVTEVVKRILSQCFEEHFAMLTAKQNETLRQIQEKQARLASETIETLTALIEMTRQKRTGASESAHKTKDTSSAKVRSIREAPSRKRSSEYEIDTVVWPLLNMGLTVRAVAAQVNISTATVGRSRKRWNTALDTSATDLEAPEQIEIAERVI